MKLDEVKEVLAQNNFSIKSEEPTPTDSVVRLKLTNGCTLFCNDQGVFRIQGNNTEQVCKLFGVESHKKPPQYDEFLQEVREWLFQHDFSIIKEEAGGNDYATVLRLNNGAIVYCWYNGHVSITGQYCEELQEVQKLSQEFKRDPLSRKSCSDGILNRGDIIEGSEKSNGFDASENLSNIYEDFLKDIEEWLSQHKFSVSKVERNGNNLATIFRLDNGSMVLCWDSGTVSVQGKYCENLQEIKKLSRSLQVNHSKNYMDNRIDNNSSKQLKPFPIDKVKNAFSFQKELSVSRFVDQLNSYINPREYELLEHKQITDALRRNNILEDFVTDRSGIPYIVPTEKGINMGFHRRKKIYESGSSIDYASYSKRAQEFVVEHLGELLNGGIIGNPYDIAYSGEDRKQRALDAYNKAYESSQFLDMAKCLLEIYLVPGTKIIHKTFGTGEILSYYDDEYVEISFKSAGNKKFNAAWLFSNRLAQTEDGELEKSLENFLPYLLKEKEINKELEDAKSKLGQFDH